MTAPGEAFECRVADVVRCGRAVSIAELNVDPSAVVAAVRADGNRPDAKIGVSCPEPTPLHESVGCLTPEMGLRTRTALARAARTRGLSTPHDEDIRALREELADIEVEAVSLEGHRRTVAERSVAVEQARVRAAEARGRVRERRENGFETDEAEARLDEALRQLSEAETAAIAARQEFDRARERRHARRDRRERVLGLQDELANHERRARAHLVDRLREEFRETLSSVPEPTAEPEREDSTAETPFEADPVEAALAIVRLGDIAAPVVLAVDRFDSPEHARDWLDAPVIRV